MPGLAQPAPAPSSQEIRLSVVADTKSGQPVTNLDEKDFTVLDNKSARPITHFRTMSPADEPVKVIVFLDAVNTPYSMLAYAREGVEKFLKLNEGQLADPTTIAVLTDQGAQLESSFSTDGNALSDALDRQQIGLRQITRESEWSGDERLQICMNALNKLISFAGTVPGRKIVLWISPGWPIMSGPRIYLDSRQEDQIFNEIVNVSTQMRATKMTLYNINPIGVGESLQVADYYQTFVKGVAKANQVQLGNLAVQVLAVQSGGLAIESNSDVTGMMQRCLNDAKSWYEIGFDPLPADNSNEYHHIEIKVDRPGVAARTRDGYYANPAAIQAR
ncbi:MAG: VWA domain-containing protein [Terracidiphilus sp.]